MNRREFEFKSTQLRHPIKMNKRFLVNTLKNAESFNKNIHLRKRGESYNNNKARK